MVELLGVNSLGCLCQGGVELRGLRNLACLCQIMMRLWVLASWGLFVVNYMVVVSGLTLGFVERVWAVLCWLCSGMLLVCGVVCVEWLV